MEPWERDELNTCAECERAVDDHHPECSKQDAEEPDGTTHLLRTVLHPRTYCGAEVISRYDEETGIHAVVNAAVARAQTDCSDCAAAADHPCYGERIMLCEHLAQADDWPTSYVWNVHLEPCPEPGCAGGMRFVRPSGTVAVARHVAVCPDCHEAVEAVGGEVTDLFAIVRITDDGVLGEDLELGEWEPGGSA